MKIGHSASLPSVSDRIERPVSVSEPSTEQFLAALYRKGVRVSVVGGKLRCSGAGDVLVGRTGSQIKARKSEIIAFLTSGRQVLPTKIEARGDAVPVLSPAQMRLWAAERMTPGVVHHIPFAIEARGALDRNALARATSRIMKRHAVLRLRVDEFEGRPVPRQSTLTDLAVAYRAAADLSQAALDDIAADEALRPFDLGTEPPLRLLVLCLGSDHYILLFTLHHIAADGGSIGILMRDFAAFYREAVSGVPPDLPDLPIQYADYAAWLTDPPQTDRIEAQLPFWQRHLGGDLPVTELPADHPRPRVQGHDGAFAPISLPTELSDQLRALAGKRGTSLFSVLLTAFNLLVHRYTGQSDLVIGFPAANRDRVETENLVGLFVNPLPMRCLIEPTQSFLATLDTVRANVLEVLAHQDVPFERLVDAVQARRDPSASPLFRLKFQLDRAPQETMDLPGLTLRQLPRTVAQPRHDLSLDLVDGPDGIRGHFEYNSALFDQSTIRRLAGHFETLLKSIVSAPERSVAELPMLTEDERHLLLHTWNDTARPLDPNQRFPSLFEAHAAASPKAIAVEHVAGTTRQSLTYGALNQRANRLAHALRHAGFGPNDIVGIAMDRGPDQVAAWLGVLKSGAAYLPLDPAYPADRLSYMIRDSGTSLVLTHSAIALPEAVERWDLGQHWPQGEISDPASSSDPQDLAYLIYTSGSTGQPKGVEVPHAGLCNLALDKIRACEVTQHDRVFGFFSFSFDASVPELVMSLGSGARLVTAPTADVMPGAALAELLRKHRVTHLTMTPSALAHLPADDLPDLRMVLVGGEAPSGELVGRWSRNRLFINAYGPTECTVNASMVACGEGGAQEPLLRPAANKQLHVLDPHGQLLPIGCPGELCVGGLGLARGYRGRPEQTAKAFVPDPLSRSGGRLYRTGDRAQRLPDGSIRLLGRIDDQLKIRGYRIEPGEIVRACQSHPGVEAAAVVPRALKGQETRLVAYLTAPVGRQDRPELRDYLRGLLPRHMLPDAFVWLDSFPLTVNGKLDLRALPEPLRQAGRGRPPEGETETALAGIFASILDIETLGATDDFFDLGGTSLMATQLVAAIEDRFDTRLRALDLFEASSVADLARRIDGTANGSERDAPQPWLADLTLASDIAPSAPVAVPATLPSCLLLTGATGFIGAHLLALLLEDPAKRVFCLLRQGESDAVEAALERYGLWRTEFAPRILPLRGDLGVVGLGVAAADRAALLSQVGAVLHCGATVHHLTPYSGLRQANVAGTAEVLKFCAEAGVPLHHISTLSALEPQADIIDETIAACDLPAPSGGYNQTKWVAEQLVRTAALRGLPVSIYRLGSIGGHSETGHANPADILTRQLSGYLASGVAPAGDALINLLPVDYAARAILHLANEPQSAGQIFHLTHSAPVSSALLFAACTVEGHSLRRLPPAEWQSLLDGIARHEPAHPLYPLSALGGRQGFAGTRWPYGCRHTRAALDPSLPEPPLTEALLRRYVIACAQETAGFLRETEEPAA